MTAVVRVGVVGGGRVAEQRHLPILAGLPGVELAALCEPDEATRRRLGERFRFGHVCADFRDLVARPGVDAVLVSAPTAVHAAVAEAALLAGKHVLVEKPIALDLDEVDRLERAAQASGRTLAVAMNSRWHRLARAGREVVRRGALGRIGLVRSVFTDDFRLTPGVRPWMLRHEQAGCVLVEQAVHHFDLWAFLLERRVESVHAVMAEPMAAGERAALTARLEGGVLVAAVFSEGLKAVNQLEVYGDQAMLWLSLYEFDGLDLTPRHEHPGTLGPRLRRLRQSLAAFPAAFRRRRTGGDWVGSYRAEWEHFLAAVRAGRPVECGLEQGRAALAVGLAAMGSLRTGAAVKVADAPRAILPCPG